MLFKIEKKKIVSKNLIVIFIKPRGGECNFVKPHQKLV